ncbi:factor H binding protein domain-containing protein [Gallibacterium melopsittaci]|uniref:Factor H binding protein domain-containing protein n=1 Tax=Gallibacterium melopsittaci TaxID=516063 RepID=A0ABV6HX93_9PAST
MRIKGLLLTFISSLILVACGSGGSGGSEGTNKQNSFSGVTQKISTPEPSINAVPKELQEKVREKKFLSALGSLSEKFITYYVALDGKLIENTKFDMSQLPEGLNTVAYEIVVQENKDSEPIRIKSSAFIYSQPYSLVQTAFMPNELRPNEETFLNGTTILWGYPTQREYLDQIATISPTTFSYKGDAFDGKTIGKFDYQIVFATKNEIYGSGKILGFDKAGEITLNSALIKGIKFNSGDVQWSFVGDLETTKVGMGRYRAALFGPKAEELTGFARLEGENKLLYDIGFGGKKISETPVNNSDK